MIRFAALGDSVTSGYGDPMPGGGWRGWAALLAEALPADTSFHNLSSSGARVADVAERQLPAALDLRPHLASVLVGMNDTLRGDFDPDDLGRRLDDVVAALSAAGATVLTARLPDPGRMFGLPGVIARPLGRRMAALNTAFDEIALRYATIHVDLAGGSAYTRTHWSVDRLHPSEVGHRFLAYRFATALQEAGHPVRALPGLAATNPVPTLGARVWWMATKGNQWLLRRSTDLLPTLFQLAAREWLAPRPVGTLPGPER
ncbi:SGNH/GDSL hydrolase family protein [Paractinoplanes lichenicola]|uniref:SGNH/GDSL hydrolase family protein n=1 Tax=Paractinoplanes lichenicola TaxID=2802976 RepID=A0ABS1W175_9ACTN|nr:SGNH/GDSL hydrolase family protein [Actinoplanes lichenicola]MBL7260489.1 SGNH/GDSL hydrolase family protein [Actinoplanes lichenicola]